MSSMMDGDLIDLINKIDNITISGTDDVLAHIMKESFINVWNNVYDYSIKRKDVDVLPQVSQKQMLDQIKNAWKECYVTLAEEFGLDIKAPDALPKTVAIPSYIPEPIEKRKIKQVTKDVYYKTIDIKELKELMLSKYGKKVSSKDSKIFGKEYEYSINKFMVHNGTGIKKKYLTVIPIGYKQNKEFKCIGAFSDDKYYIFEKQSKNMDKETKKVLKVCENSYLLSIGDKIINDLMEEKEEIKRQDTIKMVKKSAVNKLFIEASKIAMTSLMNNNLTNPDLDHKHLMSILKLTLEGVKPIISNDDLSGDFSCVQCIEVQTANREKGAISKGKSPHVAYPKSLYCGVHKKRIAMDSSIEQFLEKRGLTTSGPDAKVTTLQLTADVYTASIMTRHDDEMGWGAISLAKYKNEKKLSCYADNSENGILSTFGKRFRVPTPNDPRTPKGTGFNFTKHLADFEQKMIEMDIPFRDGFSPPGLESLLGEDAHLRTPQEVVWWT
ncbi:hypothetical protein BDK51DRAFT_31065 [Blyttiomyces helicus]|uniref:Uncharacterized protein n=1 Tax=Blyttiomyces helicus TaxID=388810 RepID=A0A4P9W739_9FUNG|nr:hypothetical protein BDK51DRAFT_31065 [Blyttiomyces helicus]|eukprot:RKO86570.1 hypothetical protein BDK51DRAFT_31065 [Blyttiomyces helicus]